MMLAHRPVMLRSSPALSVAGENRDSVTLGVLIPAGAKCKVVPQASMPPCRAFVAGSDATSLITAELGTTCVNVLVSRSAPTERCTNAFGVTRQEQHDTSCSSGENVYTLTQRLPTGGPKPGPCSGAPLRPVLVMSIKDSPLSRFEA